jgi:hypothetical protein
VDEQGSFRLFDVRNRRVLAMTDRAMQWTLVGVLSGSQRLRDVLTGWVAAPGE